MIMKIKHKFRKLTSIWNQNIGLLKWFKGKQTRLFWEKSATSLEVQPEAVLTSQHCLYSVDSKLNPRMKAMDKKAVQTASAGKI